MKDKIIQGPNFRQAITCSGCKNVKILDGKLMMKCKKYDNYILADSVCDDHTPLWKEFGARV